MNRREFIQHSILTTSLAVWGGLDPRALAAMQTRIRMPHHPRVGAVALANIYALGLNVYGTRPGQRWDVFRFIEETRKAGGEVAQIFPSMIGHLDAAGLNRLSAKAEALDVRLEIHGGNALNRKFERAFQLATALRVKLVGCSFGMLPRPHPIATLDAWDRHYALCRNRLRQLVDAAQPLGIVIAVENHLDFTVEELHRLVTGMNSPHVGVLFDVGNTLGTLDDPLAAADILGPLTVATHYKDFAIEETELGFRFTMVPLGCGSLRLPEITARLMKHVGPEVNFAIEMMNGQQFEVNWLEDRFWAPFRGESARQVAAALRHIRGKAIDRSEFKPQNEVDKLAPEAHIQLERDRITRCIAYLKQVLRTTKPADECMIQQGSITPRAV